MYWLCCIIYQALAVLVRPVCFIFKRARAPWHFLIGETEEIVIFYWSISRAPRQWPAGMEAITFVALSQVSVKYRACFVFTLRLSWQWYNLFSFLCGKENKLYNYLTIIWNKSSSFFFFAFILFFRDLSRNRLGSVNNSMFVGLSSLRSL